MKTTQTTISEVRLVYRTKIKASERLQVKCSKDAFDIFMGSWELDSIEHIEEFKLMLLIPELNAYQLIIFTKNSSIGEM